MNEITGGELVAKAIKSINIDTIFTLVGNQVSPILVYLKKYGIDVIDVRHEQGAVHMADGWAQVKKSAGIAIVTGGPGFGNTIGAITKAFFANTPILVITGTTVYKQKDSGGLQDLNQLNIIKDYTKWSATIFDEARIPEYIGKALSIANSGKKGPVVLEIPIDILKKSIEKERIINFNFNINKEVLNIGIYDKTVEKFYNKLTSSKKPLIIIGSEAYYENCEKELVHFIDSLGVPVVTVNKGRGIVPDNHFLCFGNGRVLEAGFIVDYYKESDLLICIGLEIDYQMASLREPCFNGGHDMICITNHFNDLIQNNHRVDLTILGSIKENIQRIKKEVKKYNYINWIKYLRQKEKNYYKSLNKEYSSLSIQAINPILLFNAINKYINDNTIIVLDGSNAMFWGNLLCNIQISGQVILAPDGTYGPMGTGLALAIGAKIASPSKEVVLYTGDGSFGFNMMELDTIMKRDLNIKIIIHNDKSWGFCESTQDMLYDSLCATKISDIEYHKLIEVFKGKGLYLESNQDIENRVKECFQSKKLSCLNVAMDTKTLSPGSLEFNKSLKKMT